MILMVLSWLAERFQDNERVRFGLPVLQQGERFRADAKAEGNRVVIGGWELSGGDGTRGCRWYSLELDESQIPWAYARGDPFRSISALELLATLVCVVVFRPEVDRPTRMLISLTASGDNQSNGFVLDRLATTKFPLYLILRELAEQLRRRQILLTAAWRPRDENEEADALTNGIFTAFDAEMRIPVLWEDLGWLVLPRLAKAAEDLFRQLKEEKAVGPPRWQALGSTARKVRRKRQEGLEPW